MDIIDVVEKLHVRSIVAIKNGQLVAAPKIVMGYDEDDVLKKTKKLFAEAICSVTGQQPTNETVNAFWKEKSWWGNDGSGCYVEIHDPTVYAE